MTDRLFKLLPQISDQDPSIKSFDVRGWVGTTLPRRRGYEFRACYRAPDQRALYLYDSFDGTPLYVWAGGTLVFYDAIHGSLVRCSMPTGDFRFMSNRRTLDVNWNFNDRGKNPSRMLIDVRSLMTGEQLHADARGGEGRYLLGYVTDSGVVCAAAIDEHAVTPCTHLEMSKRGSGEGMVLESIHVNEPVSDSALAVPAIPPEHGRLNIVDRSLNGEDEVKEFMIYFASSWTGRIAIHEPSARPPLEKFLAGNDWDSVKALDAENAPVVRKLLGHGVVGGAAATTTAPSTQPASPPVK